MELLQTNKILVEEKALRSRVVTAERESAHELQCMRLMFREIALREQVHCSLPCLQRHAYSGNDDSLCLLCV